jgi:hypothetical protein
MLQGQPLTHPNLLNETAIVQEPVEDPSLSHLPIQETPPALLLDAPPPNTTTTRRDSTSQQLSITNSQPPKRTSVSDRWLPDDEEIDRLLGTEGESSTHRPASQEQALQLVRARTSIEENENSHLQIVKRADTQPMIEY